MSFTEEFKKLATNEKLEAVQKERQKRLQADTTKYVAVPACAPVFGGVVGPDGEPATDFRLGWLVVSPSYGVVKEDGSFERGALSLPFPDEDFAEDLSYLLNYSHGIRLWRENNDNRKSDLAAPKERSCDSEASECRDQST